MVELRKLQECVDVDMSCLWPISHVQTSHLPSSKWTVRAWEQDEQVFHCPLTWQTRCISFTAVVSWQERKTDQLWEELIYGPAGIRFPHTESSAADEVCVDESFMQTWLLAVLIESNSVTLSDITGLKCCIKTGSKHCGRADSIKV